MISLKQINENLNAEEKLRVRYNNLGGDLGLRMSFEKYCSINRLSKAFALNGSNGLIAPKELNEV